MRDTDHVNSKALEGLMHSFDRVIGKRVGTAELTKVDEAYNVGVVNGAMCKVDETLSPRRAQALSGSLPIKRALGTRLKLFLYLVRRALHM